MYFTGNMRFIIKDITDKSKAYSYYKFCSLIRIMNMTVRKPEMRRKNGVYSISLTISFRDIEANTLQKIDRAITKYVQDGIGIIPDLHIINVTFRENLDDEDSEYKPADDMPPTEEDLDTLVTEIAKELKNTDILEEEKHYTNPDKHIFKMPIVYNVEENWFELSIIHFKVFLEEKFPDKNIHTKMLSRDIRNILQPIEIRKDMILLDNEELIKEWKSENPKVNMYRFRFSEFIDMQEND